MKYDDIEKDTLKFCAEEVSRIAQDKGISLSGNMVTAALKEIIEGKSTVTASSVEDIAEAKYNQAADLVAASIHSILNGEMERGLKLFSTIAAIEDAPTLVCALLANNESAMEVLADGFDEEEAPGELGPDFIDLNDGEEDLDIIENYPDDPTTMNPDAPLIDIGEQDDTYDSPEADQDTNASDDDSGLNRDVRPAFIDDGSISTANVDELVANILENGEDSDIGPGPADPIKDVKDRKEKGEFDKPKKRTLLTKPHGKAKHLSDNEVQEDDSLDSNEDLDTENEILAIMKSEKIQNMNPVNRTELIAYVNKISESGKPKDRANSLKFLKMAVKRI